MPAQVIVTVDVVLLTLKDERLQVALMKRPQDPFKGELALPGGYVHAEDDADVAAAAYRVLRDKMKLRPPYLEQLGSFSGARRDPRGWSISVCHLALVTPDVIADTHWFPADKLPRLAFDHASLVAAAATRVRNKSSYSALPAYLLPETFTLSELQTIYSQVLGEALEKSSFRRKLRDLDFLEEIPGAFKGGKQRPAQLYRLKGMAVFDRTI
ncbi:MAG: NUDIX hydrolase [Rhodocyclales bacterium]|nr:NUDIX hydrolase [Rhodocyclales bacterium]